MVSPRREESRSSEPHRQIDKSNHGMQRTFGGLRMRGDVALGLTRVLRNFRTDKVARYAIESTSV